MTRLPLVVLLACSGMLTACSKLEDPSLGAAFSSATAANPVAKTAVAANPDRNLFFGDLHIHTSLSTDAYVFGVRSLPEDVYTFAKGGTIEHGAGYPIKISRPLDFVAVTDHAEYMGQARLAKLEIPTTQRSLRDLLLNGNAFSITLAWLRSANFVRTNGFGYGIDKIDRDINLSAWQMTIDAAERNNNPGVFTAFIAYEWSAFAGGPTTHIHRNVIYRSNNVSELPFSYLDSQQPEDLWAFLDGENQAGRQAFAIPHNANLSKGNMYADRDSNNNLLTSDYAAMRNRNEPVSEILQIKGSSETHPLLSNLDEFANFELTSLSIGGDDPTMDTVKGSYARDALRVGLEFSHSEGFNPYKFGVIGSSDSHNASSPTQENNYHGKLPMMDGSAGLRTDEATLLPKGLNPVTRWGSGGLAGVWSVENTRTSLYDALARREVFATSGPRISVRFFGGWGFNNAILSAPDMIKQAYTGGVPMGGQITSAPAGVSPSFVVAAMKDPQGAHLDRIQIIKGWLDAEGNSHEKVYDIAASDNRISKHLAGKLPSVGNTVNVKSASYTNSIGAATLATLWTDPDFNANAEAFYYARVIEIPTPRWSTYDAKALGKEAMNPSSIQERAITSAIWYAPQ